MGEDHLSIGSSSQLPTLVDIDAVACSFGISTRHVDGLSTDGTIPFVRVGHLIRFDSEELNHWIDVRRAGPIKREPDSSGVQTQPKVDDPGLESRKSFTLNYRPKLRREEQSAWLGDAHDLLGKPSAICLLKSAEMN